MSMGISEAYDQADQDVDTLAYMNAFVEGQLTPFERELLRAFMEERISLTLESLNGFNMAASDYNIGTTDEVAEFVSSWEELLWDAVVAGGEDENRSALDTIMYYCDHMYISGPASFRRALVHTALVFKAEEIYEALERYKADKIEQRFAELARGE